MRINRQGVAASLCCFLVLLLPSLANGQSATTIPSDRTITVDQLAAELKGAGARPLILQVGSHVLYQQAHILGSEYVGAASSEDGLTQLRHRVEKLPKSQPFVLYCGCCPWSHCPNVKPAYDALVSAGFANVKVLYIANNFGTDWVDKGYPTAKGDKP